MPVAAEVLAIPVTHPRNAAEITGVTIPVFRRLAEQHSQTMPSKRVAKAATSLEDQVVVDTNQ